MEGYLANNNKLRSYSPKIHSLFDTVLFCVCCIQMGRNYIQLSKKMTREQQKLTRDSGAFSYRHRLCMGLSMNDVSSKVVEGKRGYKNG